MRRALFIASVSGFLFGGIQLACAADIATKPMPTKAPMSTPVAVYDWNGIYVGGHFGYGWGHTNTDNYDSDGHFTGSGSVDRDGVFGGGQIGVNWMIMPNWLLGVEADLSGANLTGSADNCGLNGGCSHTDVKTDWFGTLRGRIGYAWNNWLLYGTGGAVWAHGHSDRTITFIPLNNNQGALGAAASAGGTHTGWTVGGGLEWGFAPNWSAKFEYLYFDVNASNDFDFYKGSTNYPNSFRHAESETRTHTIRVGVNYRFNWIH